MHNMQDVQTYSVDHSSHIGVCNQFNSIWFSYTAELPVLWIQRLSRRTFRFISVDTETLMRCSEIVISSTWSESVSSIKSSYCRTSVPLSAFESTVCKSGCRLVKLRKARTHPHPFKSIFILFEQFCNWWVNSIAVGEYGSFINNSSLKCVLYEPENFSASCQTNHPWKDWVYSFFSSQPWFFLVLQGFFEKTLIRW